MKSEERLIKKLDKMAEDIYEKSLEHHGAKADGTMQSLLKAFEPLKCQSCRNSIIFAGGIKESVRVIKEFLKVKK